ncbi:pilus assembly protein CpaF [Lachnospiraceae bacterium G11]|nr:pilus assembly protein CpaF [Lachnospiraceae bacterium G11]
MHDYAWIKDKVKADFLERISTEGELTDEEALEEVREIISETNLTASLSIDDRIRLEREIFSSIRKLDILQGLLDDPDVTEIMINGVDPIYVEKEGKLIKREERFEREKLEDVIQQIVAGCNRTVNEASPIVDARLDDGSRVNVVLSPIALNGPILTIRRFPRSPMKMDDLIRFGSITPELVEFLRKLVKAKYNIFISGGTGSGKTTFLNVLSEFIPCEERVITIEDSAELQIAGIDNLVRLETRNSNVEGCSPISIRDLIKSALRMRPDRVIVGEVRGAEALDMLQAMNTGHDGSLSTGHANSASDMLSRLETMVLMGMDLPLTAIKKQIASGIDILIHLGRLRDRSRKLLQINEIEGFVDGEIITRVLYEFEEEYEDEAGKIHGKFIKKSNLSHTEKLKAAGVGL